MKSWLIQKIQEGINLDTISKDDFDWGNIEIKKLKIEELEVKEAEITLTYNLMDKNTSPNSPSTIFFEIKVEKYSDHYNGYAYIDIAESYDRKVKLSEKFCKQFIKTALEWLDDNLSAMLI